jgi:hypothetical protein
VSDQAPQVSGGDDRDVGDNAIQSLQCDGSWITSGYIQITISWQLAVPQQA